MNELQMEQQIQCWGADLLRFCRITTGNREDGDELYQDTMLMLLEKRDRLDVRQNAKAYAAGMALKLWKGRKRKFARRLRLVPQESLEDLSEQGIQPGTAPSAEEVLMGQEQVRAVRQMVQQLPEKYRLPIQLYYSAGLTVAAIAQVLKLPENTVKSRLHRAKKTIRTKLEEMEYEGSGI